MTETQIVNMALGRIGGKQLTALDTDATFEAVQCRLHYDQTRDSLLRSYKWRFALARQYLQMDDKVPDFEWAYQFLLPQDFLRTLPVYDDRSVDPSHDTISTYAIEGDKLLTDEGDVALRYVRRVENVDEFDPLFVEALVLQLALKLIPALAGANAPNLTAEIRSEFEEMNAKGRLVSWSETNTQGEADYPTWNNSRFTGAI